MLWRLILVYTEFHKKDFNPNEAKKFNDIREKYISSILPEILKWYKDKEKILSMLDENIKIILNFNPSLDLRCANNIAIAMCGIIGSHLGFNK